MSKPKRVLHSSWTRYRAITSKGDGFPTPPGPGRARPGRTAAPIDWPTHVAGSAAGIVVLVADELGAQGDQLGQQVVAQIADVVGQLNGLFEPLQLPSCNLIISPLSPAHDGSGGAYHYGCEDTYLYCDAAYTDSGKTTLALFVAEAAEVLEALQGKGWDCGSSNGEGLSRFAAEILFPGVIDSYHTFDSWLDSDRADWIGATDPTDTNQLSTGCAVGFLFWLVSRGHDPQEIVAAGGKTLAETYKALGEEGDAYQDFKAACEERWPAGKPSGVTTDDPWGEEPPPPEPPPAEEVTITLNQDVKAGTYVLTQAGMAAPKNTLSPEQSLILTEVQELLQGGGSPEQAIAFLQALASLLAVVAIKPRPQAQE